MLTPVSIEPQFDEITEYWSPKVIGRVNDQYVKIAKLKGEFVETVSTKHTGGVVTERTRSIAEQLR